MKTKHTPGPWKYEDEYIRDQQGNVIADVHYRKPTTKVREANAQLIAAAPELLVLLKEFATCGSYTHRQMKDLLARVNEAIYEATEGQAGD